MFVLHASTILKETTASGALLATTGINQSHWSLRTPVPSVTALQALPIPPVTTILVLVGAKKSTPVMIAVNVLRGTLASQSVPSVSATIMVL